MSRLRSKSASSRRARIGAGLCLALMVGMAAARADDARSARLEFEERMKPLLVEKCERCHGGKRPKGRVDLAAIETAAQLIARPELLRRLVDVIDASEMPPEDEPGLGEEARAELLDGLTRLLREAALATPTPSVPLRRLNRFQYSHSVRDLFQLSLDVFPLSEKLMTRYSTYLHGPPGRMPDRVEVACRSLAEEGGLRGVRAYPKDLRAAHGFDNQASQLTLSPLLLDAFLRLSVSIVESPDFHEGTVGVWNELFRAPPADVDLEPEVKSRVRGLLRRAFRGPVDGGTLDRYTAYALASIESGPTFTDGMKKLASAVLSSPLFLLRGGSRAPEEQLFTLASNLSYFLWGSGPDSELLRVAESGELAEPEVLSRTFERLLADPKVERFLDTFPSQWLQIENVLAATPDPALSPLFALDTSHPASLQMVLEPLLLFDAVFVEDRSIVDLIAPTFGYRSAFLESWYTSDLRPPELDLARVAEENRIREERRDALEATLVSLRAELAALEASYPARLEEAVAKIDLSAGRARWESDRLRELAESAVFSTWRRIGPFRAANFDEAHAKSFLDESTVDLNSAHGEHRWTEAKEFVDGEIHTLTGDSSATYLHRIIQSGVARPLDVSLGTDDSFKIWLNGVLVADRKVTRGVAPDQDRIQLQLESGENTLLLKVVNGGGGYGFYFKAQPSTLPAAVLGALRTPRDERKEEDERALTDHYRSVAPELAPVRKAHAEHEARLGESLRDAELELERAPRARDPETLRAEARREFEEGIRRQLRARSFVRVDTTDPRYGGVITNAAMLSMTSGPKRTHPIARGAWIIEVIFNDIATRIRRTPSGRRAPAISMLLVHGSTWAACARCFFASRGVSLAAKCGGSDGSWSSA